MMHLWPAVAFWIPSMISSKVGHGFLLPGLLFGLLPFGLLPFGLLPFGLLPFGLLLPGLLLPGLPPTFLPATTSSVPKQASTAACILVPISVPTMHIPAISYSDAQIPSSSSSISSENSSEEKAVTATRQKGRRTKTFMLRSC